MHRKHCRGLRVEAAPSSETQRKAKPHMWFAVGESGGERQQTRRTHISIVINDRNIPVPYFSQIGSLVKHFRELS